MKKYIITLIILMAPTVGFSALAPLPQSLREIEAILVYPSLNEYLPSSSKINEITRVSDGYVIITDSHILKVTVKYDKQPRIGPKKFTLHFCSPIPLTEK